MQNISGLFINKMLIPLATILFLLFVRYSEGMLFFHTIVESFSIIVSALMLVVAWQTFRFTNNHFLLYLGIGYAAVAVLDSFHNLTMAGMPFFQSYHHQLTVHFWIYARLLESFVLISSPIFLIKTIKPRRFLFFFLLLSVTLSYIAFHFEKPIMITTDGLTPLKIFAEYFIITILFIALFVFVGLKKLLNHIVWQYLLFSIFISACAEITFTFYQNFENNAFVVGHILKLFSYWLIYRAIVRTTLTEPFTQLAKRATSYDNIPHIAIVIDSKGRIAQANQAALAFLEKDVTEVIGFTEHQLFHSTVETSLCDDCQTISKLTQSNNSELKIGQRTFILSTAPIKLSAKSQGYVHLYTDITSTKKAELKLLESESRFRTLFEQTEAISVRGYNKNRELIYCNPAFEKMFHCNASNMLGALFEQCFIPNEDLKPSINLFNEWLKSNKPIPSSERKVATSTGEIISVYTSRVLIENIGNEPELYCFDIDLTDLKKAEAQSEKNRAIIDSVFSVLPDIFFLMDFNGIIVDYRSKDSNDLFVPPAKFLGKTMGDVLPDVVGELFALNIEKVKQQGTLSAFEYQLFINNENRYFQARLTRLNTSEHIIAVIQDITERKSAENELYHREQMYRQMFQDNRAIKLIIDPDSNKIIDANEAAQDFYGYGKQLLSMTIDQIRLSDSSETANQLSLAKQKQKTIFHFKHKTADGDIKDVEVYSGPVTVDNKTLLYSIIQDITEQRVMEGSLITKERQIQDFFDNTTSIIYIKDLSGMYLSTNYQYEKLLGVSAKGIIGKYDDDFFPPNIAKQFRTMDNLAIEKNEAIEQEETAIIAGKERHYISVKFPLKNNKNEIYGVCGISTDITARKEAEQKVLHQAHYDSLTNLPNRFLSLDRLSQLISEAKRNREHVAVLFLDLDNFKKINDTLGHDIGDKLLVESAIRLKNIVRGGDTVGRLGGDEFIILLRDLADKTYAQPVVDHLLEEFRKPFEIDSKELAITVSVGISLYPDDGQTDKILIRNADSAMYNAKGSGRNGYSYFTQEMNAALERQILLEQHLKDALENNEFEVYFQPQIDVKTNEIIGAEALIRWRNSKLGSVSPAEFITIAEQTGLIVSIGQFVIKQSLAVFNKWQQRFGTRLRIAVNLSPRQFRDLNLIDFIKSSLKEESVPPQQLELEITEGVLLSGHAYVDKAIQQLSELGVLLSMDDFGTGYSSMSYLRNYPFNVLKIDRSFVDGITESEADLELVKASIAMAHSLDLKVVAEGIETKEQLAILRSLNCDIGQGFFMAKPMSATNLLEFKLTCFD